MKNFEKRLSLIAKVDFISLPIQWIMHNDQTCGRKKYRRKERIKKYSSVITTTLEKYKKYKN